MTTPAATVIAALQGGPRSAVQLECALLDAGHSVNVAPLLRGLVRDGSIWHLARGGLGVTSCYALPGDAHALAQRLVAVRVRLARYEALADGARGELMRLEGLAR